MHGWLGPIISKSDPSLEGHEYNFNEISNILKASPQKVIALSLSPVFHGASLMTVKFLWHTAVAVPFRWLSKNPGQVSMPEFKKQNCAFPGSGRPSGGRE